LCFPVRFPPFGGGKKTHEPLAKSTKKDQADEIHIQRRGTKITAALWAKGDIGYTPCKRMSTEAGVKSILHSHEGRVRLADNRKIKWLKSRRYGINPFYLFFAVWSQQPENLVLAFSPHVFAILRLGIRVS